MKVILFSGLFALSMMAQQTEQVLPDGPAPQAIQGVGTVTPGKGSSSSTADPDQPPPPSRPAAAANNAAVPAPAADANDVPEAGLKAFTLRPINVNFVELPFTVKDKHGVLVSGLTWRDVQIFENGVRQHMTNFSVDPAPISAAFVIDQSLPFNVMSTVNNSLAAVQGAFAPYDELAIYTYNNGPRMQTDFTGAQSPRVAAVLERSKSTGREPLMAMGGPTEQTISINGGIPFDPNTSARRNSNPGFQTIPKEVHTLNDAIFMAAQSLRTRARGRRRVLYVISDGKEQGSTIKSKELLRYLQTNNITVYATLVGDSATWGIGYLDRFHIPLTMRDNILPQYVAATGGQAISGVRQRSIEESFQKIAEQVRTQYTVGYYSSEPFIDGKYRTIEVQVMRPGLDVITKKGYFPTPAPTHTSSSQPATSAAPAQ